MGFYGAPESLNEEDSDKDPSCPVTANPLTAEILVSWWK